MVYGHRWTSSYGETDDGTWFHGVKNIPIEKIQQGLRQLLLRANTWPPSLPEFIRLCLGLQDLEMVTQKLFRKDFSDPLTLAIKQQIGSWNLNNHSEKDLRRQIAELYDPCFSAIIRQYVVSEPAVALEQSTTNQVLAFPK